MRTALPVLIWLGIILSPQAFAQTAPAAGAVPDGSSMPGAPLTISHGVNGAISLSWGASCVAGDSDYVVYEGRLGDFTSHEPRTCSTGGATTHSLLPPEHDTYYLIVPHNGEREGAYGRQGDGSGRHRSRSACLPQAVACGSVSPNAAPSLSPDTVVTPIGRPVLVEVLLNDVDPDGGPQPLLVTGVTQPPSGLAEVLADGRTVRYTPDSATFGPVSFTYTASDGASQGPAQVLIQVGPFPPEPQCTVSATPESLPPGGPGTSLLTWSTTDATRVTLNGGRVPSSGTIVVRPQTSASFTLMAHGQDGTLPALCHQDIQVPDFGCLNDTLCPVTCGSGLIPDIRTGDLIQLDPEDMVHVLIAAEGYTLAGIGTFNHDAGNDVEDWMSEWEALEIYDQFREAFCFWMLPAISNEVIVPGGGVEDTAFLVPIDAGGDVSYDDATRAATAARLWQGAALLPFPPSAFYPASVGRTSGLAKNLVIVVLVYQSSSMGSGYSGATSLFANPDDAAQSVAVAVAHSRPHEFTHAFTRLRDEYLDLAPGSKTCHSYFDCGNDDAKRPCPELDGWESVQATNVVCEPQCALQPWLHLLPGNGINPGAQGIGAFGHPDEGYHPEMKCLMNGTRPDNDVVFGLGTNLRTPDHMCNFCRELTAFRLFERIRRLDNQGTSYAIWGSNYREPFYDTYGFDIPIIQTIDWLCVP